MQMQNNDKLIQFFEHFNVLAVQENVPDEFIANYFLGFYLDGSYHACEMDRLNPVLFSVRVQQKLFKDVELVKSEVDVVDLGEIAEKLPKNLFPEIIWYRHIYLMALESSKRVVVLFQQPAIEVSFNIIVLMANLPEFLERWKVKQLVAGKLSREVNNFSDESKDALAQLGSFFKGCVDYFKGVGC